MKYHFECKEIIVFTLQIFIRLEFNFLMQILYKSNELYDSGPHIGHPELIILHNIIEIDHIIEFISLFI